MIETHYQNGIQEHYKDQTPQHILIDMRWMLPGLAGGIEQVARSFVEQLLKIDQINHYSLLLPRQIPDTFNTLQHPKIHLVSRDTLPYLSIRLLRRIGHILNRPRILCLANKALAKLLKVDMVYSFTGITADDVSGLKQVVMVPDIQHEFFPEFFTPEVIKARRIDFSNTLTQAVHIIAISEFTKQTLIDKLQITANKISVAHLAADAIFKPEKQAQDEAVVKHYQLPEQFLFLPAHTWKHKNHIVVLEALKILREQYSLQVNLVLSGGSREAQPTIDQFIQDNQLDQQIYKLGYIKRLELPSLYRKASALVFPSLFEGFGMPVLEAMSCACPVICSNTTSLPEIAGDAALLVDPTKPQAFADAIYQLLTQPKLADTMRKKGLAQAQKFSWEQHTKIVVDIFHQAYASRTW